MGGGRKGKVGNGREDGRDGGNAKELEGPRAMGNVAVWCGPWNNSK